MKGVCWFAQCSAGANTSDCLSPDLDWGFHSSAWGRCELRDFSQLDMQIITGRWKKSPQVVWVWPRRRLTS